MRVGLVGDRVPRKTIPSGWMFAFDNDNRLLELEGKIEEMLFTVFFSYINCSCQGKTVILLENVFTNRLILSIIAKILFTKLKIEKLELALSCVTPLYLTSRYSGIVICSGASSTEIMPIYEGNQNNI